MNAEKDLVTQRKEFREQLKKKVKSQLDLLAFRKELKKISANYQRDLAWINERFPKEPRMVSLRKLVGGDN